MAGATLTTFDKVLKEFWLGPLRDALNSNTILLSRLQRNEKDVEGHPAKAKIPIRTGRNEGHGTRGEDEDLPTPGQQAYSEVLVPMRYWYGRIRITGQVMKASISDKGSFVRAVKSETTGLAKDGKRDLNRMAFRSGTGILAMCGTTSSTTALQLAATADMRWFAIGMVVDVVVASSGATSTGALAVTVSAVNKSTKVLTISSAVTTDSTFAVYRQGTRNKDIMGVDGIVNNIDPDDVDGTNFGVTGGLQGVPVVGNDWWKATVVSNSGTAGTNAILNPEKMQEVLDTTDNESGEEPTIIICQSGLRAEYVKGLLPDVRFGGDLKLDGGWKGIAYSGGSNKTIPIVVERDCYPRNTMYFLTESVLTVYRQADFEWMDEDGAILHRISNRHAYEATVFSFMEIGTQARNAHGRLNDITPAYTPGSGLST